MFKQYKQWKQRWTVLTVKTVYSVVLCYLHFWWFFYVNPLDVILFLLYSVFDLRGVKNVWQGRRKVKSREQLQKCWVCDFKFIFLDLCSPSIYIGALETDAWGGVGRKCIPVWRGSPTGALSQLNFGSNPNPTTWLSHSPSLIWKFSSKELSKGRPEKVGISSNHGGGCMTQCQILFWKVWLLKPPKGKMHPIFCISVLSLCAQSPIDVIYVEAAPLVEPSEF